MAKQMKQSGLVGRLGQAGSKAVASHKDDETVFDQGGGLPPNVSGVARLVSCKFGVYEKGDYKGEYFFMAAGVCVMPKVHDGIPVAGGRTQIGPWRMCDNKKANTKEPGKYDTMEGQIARVLNEYRKLGIDTGSLDVKDLEPIATTLEEQAPYFKFRTWQGDPDTTGPYKGKVKPINHVWNGYCDFDEESGQVTDPVEDNTPAEEPDEPADEPAAEDEVDLAQLGEFGDNEEAEECEESQATLTSMAKEAGLDPDNFDTWAALAEALGGEGNEGGDDVVAAEEPNEEPQKGEVWQYKATAKTKKTDAEILKLLPGGKYSVKILTTNKTVTATREQLVAE